MRNEKTISDYNLLFIILSTTTLFDGINGLLGMYFSGPFEKIVPLYRLILVLYYIYLTMEINKKLFFKITLVSSFLLCSILLVGMINNYNSFFFYFEDVMYGIKLLNFFILLNLLLEIKDKVGFYWFNRVLLINAYIMNILIIVPTYLNLSRQTYHNSSLGSMGFYIANNSANISLIILSFLVLYNIFYISDNKKMNILLMICSIWSLWLQSTKASFFVIGILLIIILLKLSLKIIINNNFKIKTCIMLLIVIFLLILISTMYNIEYNEIIQGIFKDFLERQKYQMIAFSGNVIFFLTSGRIKFLKFVGNELIMNNMILNWFIGSGLSNIKYSIGKLTEMDIFDIYISTGLVGLAITYGETLRNIVKMKTIKKEYFFIKLTVILVIMFSVFAGHVYVDIISNTLLALLIITMNIDSGERYKNEIVSSL